MFTFDQLAGFIAVAEELHFGRAAERLNMTQPPLSRQIQKLEKTVGAELLERDNRKVELTPAGRAFLDEARRLMALAERAPVTARRIASGRSGLLRIGFTAASGFSILGPLLEEIAAILPDVDIDLQELVTGEQIAGLQTGELDLGLARPPFDSEVFDSHLLYREAMVLAVPSGHPLAGLDRDITERGPQGRAADHALAHPGPVLLRPGGPDDPRPARQRGPYRQPDPHHGLAGRRQDAAWPSSRTPRPCWASTASSSCRCESSVEDPVELHAIWNRNIRNPALARLLRALDSRDN